MELQNNDSASPYYLRSESDDISGDVEQSLQDEDTEDGTTVSGMPQSEKKDVESNTGKAGKERQPEDRLPAHPEERDFTD